MRCTTSGAILLLALGSRRHGRRRVVTPGPDSDVTALAGELTQLAGASLAPGGERRSRSNRVKHLVRTGLTPEESRDQAAAAIRRQRAHLDRLMAARRLNAALYAPESDKNEQGEGIT